MPIKGKKDPKDKTVAAARIKADKAATQTANDAAKSVPDLRAVVTEILRLIGAQ